jgi:gamma-D-glutamyl-L-lysine dipeptidyl-peptidase
MMRRLFPLVVWCLCAAGAWAVPPDLQLLVKQYSDTLPKGYGSQAVLNVQASDMEGKVFLRGQVLTNKDRVALRKLFERVGKVEDEIEVFPFAAVGEKPYGIVRLGVADMRAEPRAESGLESQALVGDTLKILAVSEDGLWLKVLRDWDEYPGWVESKNVVRWSAGQYLKWAALPKVVLLNAQPNFPRGSLLPIAPKRIPPTDTTFVLSSEGKVLGLSELTVSPVQTNATPKRSSIVGYAKLLLADQPTHYLWGGVADRNLDCSAFNQIVYRLSGKSIPRDSYQQQAYARPIAPKLEDWKQLAPGDLLFFSENGKRATHTGIYIGEGKFIHSSKSNDGIAMNDLNGSSDYEVKLRKFYWGAGRILER